MNPDRVAAALAEVRQRIDSVLRPWSHPVQIVAVTKGFGSEAITAASAAGVTPGTRLAATRGAAGSWAGAFQRCSIFVR